MQPTHMTPHSLPRALTRRIVSLASPSSTTSSESRPPSRISASLSATLAATVSGTWRDADASQYYRHRKVIVAILLQMIKSPAAPGYIQRMLHPDRANAITVAQRLEYLLFRKAASLSEYITTSTLPRRLQYLALYCRSSSSLAAFSSGDHPSAAQKRKIHRLDSTPEATSARQQQQQPSQRPKCSLSHANSFNTSTRAESSVLLRQRLNMTRLPSFRDLMRSRSSRSLQESISSIAEESVICPTASATLPLDLYTTETAVPLPPMIPLVVSSPSRRPPLLPLFFDSHAELVLTIFSYLSDTAICHARGINRYCHATLPTLVTSLTLSHRQLAHLLSTRDPTTVLSEYHRVTSITLQSSSSESDTTDKSTDKSTDTSTDKSTDTSETSEGQNVAPSHLEVEALMQAFSTALGARAVPQLTCLVITSFFPAQSRQCVRHLMAGLAAGCKHLERLDLTGNFLADHGAQCVASLLRSGHCHALTSLNLSHNFIGEQGGQRLGTALLVAGSVASNLHYLNLSANILTSEAITALSKALGCKTSVPTLETLVLEHNFLPPRAIKTLLRSLSSHHASSSSSSSSLSSFKHLQLQGNNLGWRSEDATEAQEYIHASCPFTVDYHFTVTTA